MTMTAMNASLKDSLRIGPLDASIVGRATCARSLNREIRTMRSGTHQRPPDGLRGAPARLEPHALAPVRLRIVDRVDVVKRTALTPRWDG